MLGLPSGRPHLRVPPALAPGSAAAGCLSRPRVVASVGRKFFRRRLPRARPGPRHARHLAPPRPGLERDDRTARASLAPPRHGSLHDRHVRVRPGLERSGPGRPAHAEGPRPVGGRWLGSWLERNAVRFQRADDHLLQSSRRSGGRSSLPCFSTRRAGWCGAWRRGSFSASSRAEVFVRDRARGRDGDQSWCAPSPCPSPPASAVQDVGYVPVPAALGVSDATTVGTAFVL